jgi:hypothetical protein
MVPRPKKAGQEDLRLVVKTGIPHEERKFVVEP